MGLELWVWVPEEWSWGWGLGEGRWGPCGETAVEANLLAPCRLAWSRRLTVLPRWQPCCHAVRIMIPFYQRLYRFYIGFIYRGPEKD
jgi:hypothetical protein